MFLLKFRDEQPFYGVPGVVLSTKASIYASVNSGPKRLLSTMFFLRAAKYFQLALLLTRSLRTVPTIVIAHTFCASPDTRISYR